jgi:hypothetical protein
MGTGGVPPAKEMAMVRTQIRSLLTLTLAIGLLVAPVALAAPSTGAHHGGDVWSTVVGLWQELVAAVTGASGDAGPGMDPNGLTADAGPGMDPNGLSADAGPGMDPNG